jgi:hypothetical protein
VSPTEGEISKLGLQASLSCLDVTTCSGMVVVMILFTRCDMAWHDATAPVIAALSAWRWFTNCPARRGLAAVFVIVFCSPVGIVAIVREHVAALG